MLTREQLEKMTSAERQAIIRQLQAEILTALEGAQPHVEHLPPAVVEPEPVVKPETKRQRRRLAAFDAMTDDEQVDQLKSMWG